MPEHRSAACALLAFMLVAACGGGQSGASSAGAVRDSAGITIVENATPAWTDSAAWRIADTPALSIGVAEGDPDHELYQVRGAVRLSDGTIVVANGGTHQLRFYDADGALRGTAGRQGGGPGEFQLLAAVERLPADTVLAVDARNRRLSIFDPSGRHIRDVPLGGSNPFLFLSIVGALGEGAFLATAPTMRMGPDLLNRPVGPAVDSMQLFRVDSTGATTDTIGVFPGMHVNVRPVEIAGRSMPIAIPVGFSPATQVAAGPDAVYIGLSETYEIGVYSPGGALRRIIRKSHEPRAVTERDKKTFHDRVLTRASQSAAGRVPQIMEQMIAAMADAEFPQTMPAYGRLLVDPDRNLWVAEYRPSDDEPQHWTVFDPEGHLLDMVTLPRDLNVTDIGSDYVLGRVTDDAEVEHVVLYELIKPAG
jgi:hypothetical protein